MIASFLLYFLTRESSAGTMGLSINGQSRGLSTRVMIDVLNWKSFKKATLERHYDTFTAERLRKVSNVLTPETKLVELYDASSIKRLLGQKHCQSRMFDQITNLYESLDESASTILELKNEKADMQETIDSLESAIRRLQRDTEGSKRRISASKGQMTKRLNALALETENRNTEWRRCESELIRRAGYNKMVSTKNATTIKKGMEKFSEEKVVLNDKISLPLLMFDNIKENIELLNNFNSFESIKVILCVILTLIIPQDSQFQFCVRLQMVVGMCMHTGKSQ